jgi:AP-1-like factor
MDVPQNQRGSNHTLNLSPHQQTLLFAALNSNRASSDPARSSASANMASTIDDSILSGDVVGSFDDSPFIDYDYDFDVDGNFDYDLNNDSQPQMIGKLPGSNSSDGDGEGVHEKRSHPDDDGEDEGGGKRREGEDKTSKKPGRKPLTSEPTSVSPCPIRCPSPFVISRPHIFGL